MKPRGKGTQVFHYHGSNYFRLRVVLATIFKRPIVISHIRADDAEPGLRDYEANLLRLLDRITDGASFHIDVTGTKLRYRPGIIVGGTDIVHDCGTQRNISYYVEALLLLAPFGKHPLSIKLKGITHGTTVLESEPSVDHFRTVALAMMSKLRLFTEERHALTLRVCKKGLSPLGGGEVDFMCPIVRNIPPFQLTHEGRVKRVRGTAYNNHVSSQFPVRMIDRARGVLNDFLPDVWVYTSSAKGGIDGPSAGYGMTLVAESMKGFFHAAERCVDMKTQAVLHQEAERSREGVDNLSRGFERSMPLAKILEKNQQENTLPSNDDNSETQLRLTECERVGRDIAHRLLLEVQAGGILDTTYQHILFLFMALAEETQPCKIKLGQLTPYSIQFLRHLYDFCHVKFSIEAYEEEEVLAPNDDATSTKAPNSDTSSVSDDVDDMVSSDSKLLDNEPKSPPTAPTFLLKCVGVGFKNIGRRTF